MLVRLLDRSTSSVEYVPKLRPTVGFLMYRRRNAAKQRVGSEQTQGSNAVLPPSPVADKKK